MSDDSDYDDLFGDEDSDTEKVQLNTESGQQTTTNSNSNNKHADICKTSNDASDEDDFEDMFGDDSSDEEEVKVIAQTKIDASKIRVPRKRKHSTFTFVQSYNRGQSPNSNSIMNQQEQSQPVKRPIRPPTPPCILTRRKKQEYKMYTMDDYYKTLRSWDFITELNSQQKRPNPLQTPTKSNQYSSDSDSSSENEIVMQQSQTTAESLPDEFDSIEEYIASWAPLQLTETKAQILSDITASIQSNANVLKTTQGVQVTPKRSDSYSEILTLDIVSKTLNGKQASMKHGNMFPPPQKRNESGIEFLQNDLVLISCEMTILEQAMKGKLDFQKTSYSMANMLSMASPFINGRLAVIGVVSNKCRSVDGLVVNISRRLWKDQNFRPRDLFLFRIGGNVTAVREFRALVGMKEMPLSKYILSPNQGLESPNRIRAALLKNPLSEGGGSNVLGIGFRIYVKSKFNQSQQEAISASAKDYGQGGFTLIQGPPGTGKTTTLVALLNALHLKQYQKYYSSVEKITLAAKDSNPSETLASISAAAEVKPRILVCAPSNAAVDNVILKIMEDLFLDGNGQKYSPSIIRIGSGQSSSVVSVSLDTIVAKKLEQGTNPTLLEGLIADSRKELRRLQGEIQNLQVRVRLIARSTPYFLSRDWEIRVDEASFKVEKRVVFLNHKTKKVQLTRPPKPNAGEELLPTDQMPHYRSFMSNIVKYIERYNDLHSKLLQYVHMQNTAKELNVKNRRQLTAELQQTLETSILDSTHIVMTTLGTSGSKTLEEALKFSVVVIDEAAQCSEPAMLPALKLGSSHCVLVGDPQQLPATIFSISGRETKYDRSLFQRLQEAGHDVYKLNTQYRMHPKISAFPRNIFYAGSLKDGPKVTKSEYGGTEVQLIHNTFTHFKPFTILDVDSTEERDGTSLSNKTEAELAYHLFSAIRDLSQSKIKIAIITPYQQQVSLLRRIFQQRLGLSYTKVVDISTIDSFQGKESSIVILTCVRASTAGGGIGFLNDVQRMNVALTRAKNFLFVIARCSTIVVNPYWRKLVKQARCEGAVIKVASTVQTGGSRTKGKAMNFPDLRDVKPLPPPPPPRRERKQPRIEEQSRSNSRLYDPRNR